MTPLSCSPPGPPDRRLIRYGQHIVPQANREMWVRYWRAELWQFRGLGAASPRHSLAAGLVLDAVWLRKESWRRSISGSALLCLTSLALLLIAASLPVLVLAGNVTACAAMIESSLPAFAFGSLPVIVIGLFRLRISVELRALPLYCRVKACIFDLCKISLLFSLTFLVSIDLVAPLHSLSSFPGFLLQSFVFALLALMALHWAVLDRSLRCRHCLRSLAEPLRVGRPSHNFLEWNGFEMLCTRGHGQLKVPEIETSSCRSSWWFPTMLALATNSGCDRAISSPARPIRRQVP